MIDRDTVIKELENYEPYARAFSNITVTGSVILDALALLKEREPKLIVAKVRKVLWDETDDGLVYNMDTFYYCPKCGYVLSRTNENKDIHFCSKCGQAVKWDADN